MKSILVVLLVFVVTPIVCQVYYDRIGTIVTRDDGRKSGSVDLSDGCVWVDTIRRQVVWSRGGEISVYGISGRVENNNGCLVVPTCSMYWKVCVDRVFVFGIRNRELVEVCMMSRLRRL